MHAGCGFDFSVSTLGTGRWVISAKSSAGVVTVLAGVYYSQDAALSAMCETTKRWLKSMSIDTQSAIAA